jgi:TetR/AcrR family transcriptional regulator, tetracycline repressor protein
VIAGITEYFQPGRTADDLFGDCLQLIIPGEEAAS